MHLARKRRAINNYRTINNRHWSIQIKIDIRHENRLHYNLSSISFNYVATQRM